MTNEISERFVKAITNYVDSAPTQTTTPKIGTITEVSDYMNYCTITWDEGTLTRVPCHGLPKVGTTAIITFINGNYQQPCAICDPKNILDEELVDEYRMVKCFNYHNNGDFTFNKTGYTGNFTITDKESYTDVKGRCAKLEPNQTLTFQCDLRNIIDEMDVWDLRAFYKGFSKLQIRVKDLEYNEYLHNRPTPGYDTMYWQCMSSKWYQNKEIFVGNANAEITFKNVGDKTMWIDGIVVYENSSDTEYYHSRGDISGI
ncbi:hypothetical protein [Methanosphaera cuniculi]|uniref:Uncharacterized protein n=1 Tax=Methanosphaera cuniculi TaxID=1077256 RepID=A0A2A2HFA1_9EURY|nr:hypothetical protein [Methanosphaera cuniculi]PAV08109.1 hypothetical protein ASJ82_01190 [Methanosphaera cuniculi]PWL07744.1 hypothetical protein MSCUN_12750 [Methanosphaera cuniculi]